MTNTSINTIENNGQTSPQVLNTLADLYKFLDDLFEQDSDSDTLFSGGYIRGLSSLVATDFGDENQPLSAALIEAITTKINQAKTELSPQDFAIVKNFWLVIQGNVFSQ